MKSYVFDASALFVYLRGMPDARKINELLKEAIRGRAEIQMSAVNYGEVYGLAVREYGVEQGRTTMSAVYPLPILFQDATPQRAFLAAEVKVKYKLYYVDSFAAALAIEHKATLVTSDSDFRRLGHNFPIMWLKV